MVIYFNPRPREGSDARENGLLEQDKDFNPRPREGSDYQGGKIPITI